VTGVTTLPFTDAVATAAIFVLRWKASVIIVTVVTIVIVFTIVVTTPPSPSVPLLFSPEPPSRTVGTSALKP
jgi:hypothetical protein